MSTPSTSTTTSTAPIEPTLIKSLIPGTTVVVHPLVLLSIQDHAARAAKGSKKRVLGILLGQDLGVKGINVANSFAG